MSFYNYNYLLIYILFVSFDLYSIHSVISDTKNWKEFHELQRYSLFELPPDEPYDPAYHDACISKCYGEATSRALLLLKFNGVSIGITTLDMLSDGRAIMRGVAVSKDERGKGHGAALGRLVEDYARANGRTALAVNAHPEKCGFYRKLGFNEEVWSSSEFDIWLTGQATPPIPIQMIKPLA